MKFKELAIGAKFNFNRTGFEYSGMLKGPFIKLSTRKYIPIDPDIVTHFRVGSINVEVIVKKS